VSFAEGCPLDGCEFFSILSKKSSTCCGFGFASGLIRICRGGAVCPRWTTAEAGADNEARAEDNLSRVNVSKEKWGLGQAVPFEYPQLFIFPNVTGSWNLHSVDCQYDVTNMQIWITRRALADNN
jgi:hypothetical protein